MNSTPGKTILLVEDEALIAMAEKMTLERAGYAVITASTGEKAIETARKRPEIDLVLMDLDLGPGIGGSEAAQTILSEREVPLAFLSSHTEEDVVAKTEGITSYGYIVKNSGNTVLLASIRMAFRLHDAHRELLRQKRHLDDALAREEHANEQLIEKSEELERYFSTSLDMLCIANTDGEFLRLNPEWEKVLGYPLSELVGRPFMDLVHPDDREATARTLTHLKGQEEVLNLENRYRCRDGSYRWIEWRSRPMGSVIYAAARDVTERKRTQEELARTGTYYRALIEKAPDGVALLNGEGMLCYASPAARRIFGYSDDTEGPLDPDAATHPDDLSRVQETVAAVVRDPTRVATIEYRFRGKDGAWRWIESTFSNQLAEPGLEAIIINFHDVTERKKAEEALVAMETRFRTIMDSMQNADELHERAALQQLIMTMATELIDVPLAEVDDRINRMLREVGAFQDFDRVFVFRNDLERGISTNTHEWCSAGITPEIDNLQAIPLDDLSPVMAAHRKGEAYSVPRVADLPEGESVRALMEAQGIKSTLLLPLMHDGVNIGFVGFDAVREERGVTETAVELLRVMAKMIAGTESRREAEIAQNEAEQLIRENEERFRSLLDGIEAVPVQAFGPDGTVHYWNLASQHLYGYTSAEAIGRNIIDLVIPPDLRDTIKQRIAEMAASRKPIPVTEDWLVGYDGRRSLVRTNHAVVQLPGREVEIFSIDQDVTEQRQAEEEIRRLVREKETLLKEVQHRIKNTMNTMVSLLSLQADALGDSKAASALHDAENRFRSMEVLYDQLYRTDTHDSGSTREYLNPLVHRIVEVFPNSETVHITTEIEDIVLDAKRLSGVGMIVNELITNAMKYAFSDGRQGGLSVYLNAGESEITLIVTDNGPGIPETRKQASFGTTMVQALADELRGTIRFEHDGGTRVILGFPR